MHGKTTFSIGLDLEGSQAVSRGAKLEDATFTLYVDQDQFFTGLRLPIEDERPSVSDTFTAEAWQKSVFADDYPLEPGKRITILRGYLDSSDLFTAFLSPRGHGVMLTDASRRKVLSWAIHHSTGIELHRNCD